VIGRSGDRRAHPRFEVNGRLTAVLELTEFLRVANLSANGALIESLAPLPVGSEHGAALLVNGRRIRVRIRVCRVIEVPESVPRRYRLGVDFLSVAEPELLAHVASQQVPSSN
jgi:hypothetical protein